MWKEEKIKNKCSGKFYALPRFDYKSIKKFNFSIGINLNLNFRI